MCGKVTNDNLIDSSHYFRNTDQYEKLMWGFSYISFCLSKHFGESDVFISFLLTGLIVIQDSIPAILDKCKS